MNAQVVIETGSFVITRFPIKLENVKGKNAQLRIKIETTESEIFPVEYLQPVKESDDLATILKDPRLRGYRIVEIVDDGAFSSIVFENGIRLVGGEETSLERETGQEPLRRTEESKMEVKPIFNLIDRATKATGLTRKTINQIFKGSQMSSRNSFSRTRKVLPISLSTHLRDLCGPYC